MIFNNAEVHNGAKSIKGQIKFFTYTANKEISRKGAFTNYVNMFWAFFDHLPTLVCNSKHLGYHPYVIT